MGVLNFYRGKESVGAAQRRTYRNLLIERLLMCFITERDAWPGHSAEARRWDRRIRILSRWR